MDPGNDLGLLCLGDGVVTDQSVQALLHLPPALQKLLIVDVVEGHAQAAHRVLDRPTGTDDAASHTGHFLDVRYLHGDFLLTVPGA